MFGILKINLFEFLAVTIYFISLVDGLKCLECSSNECRKGVDNSTSVDCGPDTYCVKTLYGKLGKKDIVRGCTSRDHLHEAGLRLNECGLDKRFGNDKTPECICDSGDYCNSGDDFTLPPPFTGLKCLECTSLDCRHGIVHPTNISCQKGHYCEKFSYIENNKKLITRRCREQEYLLSYNLKLNDCGLYIVDQEGEQPSCYCNKDYCNSGDDFVPKPNSGPPAIDCQICNGIKCFYEEYHIDICQIGYICYKLFEVQSNVNRVVKRGCIHKEFSLDLGLKLNECGQFTNSYNEKQPICICEKGNCNGGGELKIENQRSQTAAPIHFNQLFVISTTFIGFIQILILNN